MTEKRALLLAGAAHLLLLAALSLGLSRTLMPADEAADIIPIEMMEIGPQPSAPDRPLPSRPAAPREEGVPPPPAESEPAPQAEPPPEPAPTDTAVQDAIPEEIAPPAPPKPAPKKPEPEKAQPKEKPKEPPKKAEPKPKAEKTPTKAEPKPKAAPVKTPAFDPGKMADLIDKSVPEADRKPSDVSAFAKSIEAAIPRSARPSPRAIASLEQAIRSQVAPCWNPPVGGADVANMTAVLRIRLNKDGSVAAPPEFVSQTGANAGNQSYARTFVETARRAVLRCAPLSLPDDLYSVWREFELNFDPRLMT